MMVAGGLKPIYGGEAIGLRKLLWIKVAAVPLCGFGIVQAQAGNQHSAIAASSAGGKIMSEQSRAGRGSATGFGVVDSSKMLDGYLTAWNSLAGDWGGVGKGAMQLNLEMAGLASRRAKAYLDLPARLAACRQPQDFGNLQISFWQTCLKQYAETARRVGQQMTEAQPLTGINESLSDPDSNDVKATRPQPRDFITFPEPKSEPTTDRAAGSSHAAA
jgi:hypothetical protein